MRIVMIADTHGKHKEIGVPSGDMIIFAGDITSYGGRKNLKDFAKWANSLPHKYKIAIAGNHDFCFQNHPEESAEILSPITYLKDSGIEIEGISIWGTPWTPTFGNWAFMKSEEGLAEIFDKIPKVDILVSHGPPFDIMDLSEIGNENCGSKSLLKRVWEIKPKIHEFGHIHEGYGSVLWDGVSFFNASVLNFRYGPVNKPYVTEW